MKRKIRNIDWLALVFATVFMMTVPNIVADTSNYGISHEYGDLPDDVVVSSPSPEEGDINDDAVTIVVKGGFGVNITITNNLENDTIAYSFTILWKNIRNEVIKTTEGRGTIRPYIAVEYKEALVRLITRVYVYVESEGVIVEREGFAILVFVFLKPNIEPTIL